MSLFTAKRGLLQARWQTSGFNDHVIAELRPDVYAAVYTSDIFTDDGDPEWQGPQPSFEHRLLQKPEAYTYAGWLACQVMWPFPAESSHVNTIVHVWEDGEDFRVIQVPAARLRVASAVINFISPVDQRSEFVDILAKPADDSPSSDTFM